MRHKHKKPFDIKELWAKVATMADVATETLYNPPYITDPDWKTPHVLELEYGTCKIAWFYEVDKDTGEKKGVKKRYVNIAHMYVMCICTYSTCLFTFRYISLKFMEPDMTKGKLSANGVEIKRRGVYIYMFFEKICWRMYTKEATHMV